jgi:hypothetical protein
MVRKQRSSTVGRRARDIVAQFRALFSGIFNPYRPELHYMRGPGPKWHAARNRR